MDARGGAELVALKIASILKAPIYTASYNESRTHKELVRDWGVKIFVPSMNFTSSWLLKYEMAANWFQSLDLGNYDIVVLLGEVAHNASRSNRENLWYCLSPWRLIYETSVHGLNPIARVAAEFWKLRAKPRDYKSATDQVRSIVSQSKTVQKRVQRFYHRSSSVVYPPVDISAFKCESFDDFYLVVQRLDKMKRTEIIVEAFKKMPDKNLVIVGGGREYGNLVRQSSGHKNIQFTNSISHSRLIQLYSTCIATIYLPKDEDFGLIPVESMASGKPCIGSNEGGVGESILHGKTGLLIEPKVEDLIDAVKKLGSKEAEAMKYQCFERSRDFDQQCFVSRFREQMEKVISGGT
jgi:glycosyltransferase involved in cell wall biosynthesis